MGNITKILLGSAAEFIDRFEDAWTKNPYPNPHKWLSSVDYQNTDLAIELCAVDLEWRWRIQAIAEQHEKKGVQNDIPLCPVAEDYRSVIGDLWKVDEMRQRLVMVEWGVRNMWGDRPDTDSFLSMFPDDESWQHQLEAQLDALLPLDVSILKNGGLVMEMHVPARFHLGRQKKEEPSPPAWVNSTARFLIAKGEERQISREQVQVRRTRRGELELRNAAGPFTVQLDFDFLKPNATARFALPIALRFGDILASFGETFNDRR